MLPFAARRFACLTFRQRQTLLRQRAAWERSACFHSGKHLLDSSKNKGQSVIDQIRSNPQVMQELLEFGALLQKKGFNIENGKPSASQMLKLFSDSEIKQGMDKLVKTLTTAKIPLDMSTLSELQQSLKNTTEQMQGNAMEGAKDTRQSMMSKMKDIFGKD
ncbi:hypothetical protein VTP01DRAFT_3654 [Rhizomucor pusillus]|uniref:uncharacterized protein n=1 Tax=Rhizomucor pusillus TaxID=4840 RepID=UPI003742804A